MTNKEYQKQWRLANPEKVKKSQLKYRLANIEKLKKRQRDNYAQNRESMRVASRLRHNRYNGTGVKEEGILYNYKEPLKKFKEGYGYIGTVSYNQGGDKIQCHFCGNFYQTLGTHIFKVHNLTGKQYKEKLQLMSSTALVGESVREARIKWCNDNADKIIPILQKNGAAMKGVTPVREKGKWDKLEFKNKNGTCPDQLIDKILSLKVKLGRVPSTKEFEREYDHKYLHSIYIVFGSWKNALNKLKLSSVTEMKQELMSNERLIEYLQDFYKNHKRTPKSSDFKRGLLPYKGSYYKQFGTLNNARFHARIPVMIRAFNNSFYLKEVPWEKVKRYQNTFIEK